MTKLPQGKGCKPVTDKHSEDRDNDPSSNPLVNLIWISYLRT